MAARIPGPFLQQTPIGFPSYCRFMNRDWMARKAFEKSEVNTRVYKAIYENFGVRGKIPINRCQKASVQSPSEPCFGPLWTGGGGLA
ncbi:unnamed protein product [Durusdinium trenchii]|uniref:Uncharacterized protein n=1 Tax=Durusdinium trenchii TaxID=1381693 RepID=A0ABP0I6R0_9DINO